FLSIFFFMSLASGIKIRYFVILVLLAGCAVPVLWKYVLSDYQRLRFTAVYNLDDPDVSINEGYQQYQGRISIGSGGIFGKGLFNGQRVESNAVTFQHSDFIFTVAGEELGMIGCLLIMALLIILMAHVVKVGYKAKDNMGKFICFGFFGLIALQSVSNIGMCLALLPVMGVTLPFFSAGGTSAACLYLGIGLVQSVYLGRNKKNTLESYRDIPYKELDLKKLREL
ncbi:MAG: FtsW/RodA/SpoVE family cell cycle protein, partial [Clostridia bacterium]|nr:FtsW/RodA/SpoVE family cell cycle protein [Clostridia bacterium]